MTIKIKSLQFIKPILILLLPMFFILGSLPVFSQEKVYTLGVVPQFEVRKLHGIWRPVLNYLEKETGYSFKIQGSPTITAFEHEFLQGEFDFAYMNPYHIMMANGQQGYIPLVRDVGKTLHGVLVVNINSSINEVSQLQGKTIAFPAPNALGASLLMRQELQDIYQLNIKPNYVKTHDSVYLNVLMRQASAGGGVEKTLRRQQAEYQKALKIIHKTREVAPHPLAAHPRVPESVRLEVKAALIKLGQSSEGMNLLAKIPIKRIGPASMSDYQALKDLGLERFYVK